MIIDFHTHTFPETIAVNAIPALEQRGKVKAALNGTVPDLLQSMHRNNISQSIICSIATTPKQFEPILNWSKDIRTEQIIPLPSVHPESKTIFEELEIIKKNGFKGIKLHPYYQDFFLDEDRLLPLFLQIADLGLFVVMHCGYDIGFPREERANPKQIKKLITAIPSLKFIAAHLGGWQQWDDVASHLIGKDIYMDMAFVLNFLPQTQAVKMIQNHPEDKILFGSDSPWADQKTAIEQLQNLQLGNKLEKRILYLNGQKLLDL
jgi:predicted TIM-barrel fold metal-dependent hydrolase